MLNLCTFCCNLFVVCSCELFKESEKKMSSSKLSKLLFPLVPLPARDEPTTLNWEENDAGF